MENETQKEIQKKVEELVLLEDIRFVNPNEYNKRSFISLTHCQSIEPILFRQEMIELQQTQQRNLTSVQRAWMEQAPDTLVSLEGEIEKMIKGLGSDYFQNLTGAAGKSIASIPKGNQH
jgi:hypothetical protein